MNFGDRPMATPDAAQRHYLEQRALSASVSNNVRAAWAGIDVGDLDGSFEAVFPKVYTAVAAGQTIAAGQADRYLNAVLAEQGASVAGLGSVNAAAFAGVASDGRPLATLLREPIIAAKVALRDGQGAEQAFAVSEASVVRIASTQVTDAGRAAVATAMNARPAVTSYTRQLSSPACARCIVLAGKVFRLNAGFKRHPHCQCTHRPNVGTLDDADSATTDPKAAFERLSPADQDRYFTRAGAESIRNGADIGQVVNARSGMYSTADQRLATRSSTSVRGRSPGFRPMPEQILRDAGSREEAVAGLQRYGYLTRGQPSTSRLALEQPSPAPAVVRRTKAVVSDPDVLAEARQRNVSPERVIQLREERAERRFMERRARAEAEKALTAEHPDVVRVAEKYGVHPDEVLTARLRVAEVRAVAREEAARVQAEAMRELDRLDVVKMRNPPRKGARTELGTSGRRGEYDWLEQLSEREKNRLSRSWYGGVEAPDQMAATMSHALGRDLDVDDAVDRWLELNRRAEASGALRRGKLPSLDAYSGQIEPNDLIGTLADDGFDAVRLFGDDLDAAGHVASVERQLTEDDALGYLGDASRAVEGPAPYRMGFQSWEEEVRDIEFHVVDGSVSPFERRRLAELVPSALDDPGLGYEDLYARIVATARRAGEEVPDYAVIPWA